MSIFLNELRKAVPFFKSLSVKQHLCNPASHAVKKSLLYAGSFLQRPRLKYRADQIWDIWLNLTSDDHYKSDFLNDIKSKSLASVADEQKQAFTRCSPGGKHVVLLTWGVDVNEGGEAGCSRLTRCLESGSKAPEPKNTRRTPTHNTAKTSSGSSTECQQTQHCG